MAKGKPTKVDREQDTQTKTKTDTEKQQTNSRLGTVNRTSQTKEIRVNSLEGKLNPRPKIRHQVLEQQERIDHLLTRQFCTLHTYIYKYIYTLYIHTRSSRPQMDKIWQRLDASLDPFANTKSLDSPPVFLGL